MPGIQQGAEQCRVPALPPWRPGAESGGNLAVCSDAQCTRQLEVHIQPASHAAAILNHLPWKSVVMTYSSTCVQALFCQVPTESVLTMHDVTNIWRVPLLLESQNAHHMICRWGSC
jgi:hypothetical protein